MDIVYALMHSLRDHLHEKLITDPPDWIVRAMSVGGTYIAPTFIKVGRVYDPMDDGVPRAGMPYIQMSIHPNDPDDLADRWEHSIMDALPYAKSNVGMGIGYPYEIGGGQMWWRRLKVQYVMDATEADLDQDTAIRIANTIRTVLERLCNSRSESNPDGWAVASAAEDSDGEIPIIAQVAKSHCWEGGGPDDDFIWRGAVWVQVLTQHP